MRRLTTLAVVLALAATACQIRTDIEIDINPDETGTIAFEIGFDEEFRQLAESEGGDLSLDGFDEFSGDAPPGWSVSEFDDGRFAGTRIAVPFSSLTDLRSKLAALESDGNEGDPTADFLDTVDVVRDGDTFRFEATLAQLDETVADAGGFDFGLDPTEFLGEFFLIRFVVTMPGAVTSHNADSLDGTTLVWNVPLDGESRTLRAVSGAGGGLSLALIGAAVIGLLIAGALWLTITRRRASSQTSYVPPAIYESPSVEPAQPVGADPFSS